MSLRGDIAGPTMELWCGRVLTWSLELGCLGSGSSPMPFFLCVVSGRLCCLSFLICKVEMVKGPTSQSCSENKVVHCISKNYLPYYFRINSFKTIIYMSVKNFQKQVLGFIFFTLWKPRHSLDRRAVITLVYVYISV